MQNIARRYWVTLSAYVWMFNSQPDLVVSFGQDLNNTKALGTFPLYERLFPTHLIHYPKWVMTFNLLLSGNCSVQGPNNQLRKQRI